ncbi:MAG: hypothetical protein QMD86_02170, partial [Patescibacteria group bacterium]|nr:hypothetical protein [Patescibacteria group bacterium]
MNKKIILTIIIVAVLLGIAYWIYYKNPAVDQNPVINQQAQSLNTANDSVDSITKNLNETNVSDINSEFKGIDKELGSL